MASNRASCSCVFPGCAHRLVVGLTLTSSLYKSAEFEIDNRNLKKSDIGKVEVELITICHCHTSMLLFL